MGIQSNSTSSKTSSPAVWTKAKTGMRKRELYLKAYWLKLHLEAFSELFIDFVIFTMEV